MNIQRFFSQITAVACALGVFGYALANTSRQATTVYKHTDEKGRVTYSNSPVKDAIIVELAPLTIMPAMPRLVAPAPLPTYSQPALPTMTSPPVALVSTKRDMAHNAGIGAAAMAQQRREDVHRRIIEGEIEAEEQFLREANEVLATEQARSGTIRALRATLASETSPTTAASNEPKTLIAQHFARVRDLQDQVDMHQQNLRELRGQPTGNSRQSHPVGADKMSANHNRGDNRMQTSVTQNTGLRTVRLKPVTNHAPRRSQAEDR